MTTDRAVSVPPSEPQPLILSAFRRSDSNWAHRYSPCGLPDRGDDIRIRSAAAQIPAHELAYLLIGSRSALLAQRVQQGHAAVQMQPPRTPVDAQRQIKLFTLPTKPWWVCR
jgi:hypothetical protein